MTRGQVIKRENKRHDPWVVTVHSSSNLINDPTERLLVFLSKNNRLMTKPPILARAVNHSLVDLGSVCKVWTKDPVKFDEESRNVPL